MSEIEKFQTEVKENIEGLGADTDLQACSLDWIVKSIAHKYSYNFSWLGRPIIQYPQDIVALQELIWQVKPDLVLETGIAHGGSLILSASMLALLEYCEATDAGLVVDPANPRRMVLGVDVDIREHNRKAIEAHPMSSRISLIQGSSIAPDVIGQVRKIAGKYTRILVCLDSNHTHEHVFAELEAYAPLTSKGSYCCVFDTVIEDMPTEMFSDRPWRPGDSPKSAVRQYLRELEGGMIVAVDGEPLKFQVDRKIDAKLSISVAPQGYLKRV